MKYIHVIKKDSITWIVLRNTNLILIVITFQLSVDNYSDESSIDETLSWVSVIIKQITMNNFLTNNPNLVIFCLYTITISILIVVS